MVGWQVGVLTMAGKKPTILVTPTADLGKVLNSMASLQIEGETNFSASSQIAQLALKHRQNKNQRQRIVMFVGSPLSETKVLPCDQQSYPTEVSRSCLRPRLLLSVVGCTLQLPESVPVPLASHHAWCLRSMCAAFVFETGIQCAVWGSIFERSSVGSDVPLMSAGAGAAGQDCEEAEEEQCGGGCGELW